MMWIFGLIIIAVIGGIAVVASGVGGSMPIEFDDRWDVAVPVDRPLTPGDLKAVRFTTAFRGYRTSEVDALLDLLAWQLAQQQTQQQAAPEEPVQKPEDRGTLA